MDQFGTRAEYEGHTITHRGALIRYTLKVVVSRNLTEKPISSTTFTWNTQQDLDKIAEIANNPKQRNRLRLQSYHIETAVDLGRLLMDSGEENVRYVIYNNSE